jgi:hypothetical protein
MATLHVLPSTHYVCCAMMHPVKTPPQHAPTRKIINVDANNRFCTPCTLQAQVLLRPGINETDMAPHIPEAHPRTLLVADRTLRLGAMPVSRFMTGRTFLTQRLHEVCRCTLWCSVPSCIGAHVIWFV